MIYIGNLFASLHSSTSDLDTSVLDRTTSFVYCCRDGVESVTLVTNSKETLRSLVGELPEEIYDTGRYAIDLSSIGTDKVRIYLNSQSKDEYLVGYYLSSSNSVLEEKKYKKTDTDDILIDRYDANGDLISSNEREVLATKSDWSGSSSLADDIEAIASENNLRVQYSKKADKDQSYIIVRV